LAVADAYLLTAIDDHRMIGVRHDDESIVEGNPARDISQTKMEMSAIVDDETDIARIRAGNDDDVIPTKVNLREIVSVRCPITVGAQPVPGVEVSL
jgi:hypothetical protein